MLFATLLLTAAALVAAYCTVVFLNSPLKAFPGHWLSNFSNLWRFVNVLGRRSQWTHIKLHDQYGAAVRMGPNIVSISDPAVIGEVFRTRNPWKKTPFYSVNDVLVQGQRISNVFGTLNEEWHTTVMRPIKGLYSMTKVLDGEVHINTVINSFTNALEQRFASSGKAFDMGEWIPFFAWDSMGQQTFGKPYGLIAAGKDEHKLIDTSTKGLDYFGPVSQIPQLDLLMDKNPVKRIGPPGFGWATVAAIEAVGERLGETKERELTRQSDYLDKFLASKTDYPQIVDNNLVVNYLLVNIIAGSDTTSIYMCAAIYYILKTPGVAGKLQAELDAAGLDRQTPVSWKEAQKLIYFGAIMKEAERIHPSVGLMLERVVPAEGFTLPDGRVLPAGTTVGVNPWVVSRNKDVFGKDAKDFKPERWLKAECESEETYAARVQRMQNANLTFGAGKRACLGKNIALLTAYKLVSTLFNKYEVALVDPTKQWTTKNSWFVYQYGIEVTIEERK